MHACQSAVGTLWTRTGYLGLVGVLAAVLLSCSSDSDSSSPVGAGGTSAESGADSPLDGKDSSSDTKQDVAFEAGKEASGGAGGASPEAGKEVGAEAEASAPSGLTSCTEVAHIGDSLTAYTKPSLTAAYAKVGASVQINAYGGRAILQKLSEDPMTGKQAATSIAAGGFSGCWVVALGTNDTANIDAGANYTRAEAIDAMMNAIDPGEAAPVMWVNTYTTNTSGHYANSNMILWNEALEEARSRWANLKVFDWASIAEKGTAPFADGIHHTSAGYEVRNAAIASALAGFFPAP